MDDDTRKTEARGQGGLPGNSLTTSLGRNARRALRKYATAIWREAQPLHRALNIVESWCLVTIYEPLPRGQTLYVLGALGAALPLEYGFALPGPHASEPYLHPIEHTRQLTCCCHESVAQKEGAR
jgi:hypothetical protein